MKIILMSIMAFAIAAASAALLAALVFEAPTGTALIVGTVTMLAGIAILFVVLLWALGDLSKM
jgi:hypothetical protein